MVPFNTFIKKYFNRYQFFASGHSIKNMHGLYHKRNCLLFNLKLVNESSTSMIYKFEKNNAKEPVLSLISKITHTKEPGFLKIHKNNNDENIAIVYPIGLVPTHFMMYSRDMFQQHRGYRTWIKSSCKYNEEALTEPFDFDFNQMFNPYLQTNDLQIENLRKLSIEGQSHIDNLVKEASTKLDSLDEKYKNEILKTFIEEYTKGYRFNINDKQWSSYDGMDLDYIYNKAAQFSHFSKYFHSLMGGVGPQFACEGGLSINANCPGIEYIFGSDMMYKYKVPSLRWPNSSSVRGSDMLYSKYSIAYWKMIYLRQLIQDFGIDTGL